MSDVIGRGAYTRIVHYAYVVECRDGSLYTGYTTDPERRVREHNAGEGAKYTRGRAPVTLVHVEAFASKSAAMSREYGIKRLTRRQKERLIEGERESEGEPVPASRWRSEAESERSPDGDRAAAERADRR